MYKILNGLIGTCLANTLTHLILIFEHPFDESMKIIKDSGLSTLWEQENFRYITGIGYELATFAMDRLNIEYDPHKELTENPIMYRNDIISVAKLIYELAEDLQIPLYDAYEMINVEEYLDNKIMFLCHGAKEEVYRKRYINKIKQERGL